MITGNEHFEIQVPILLRFLQEEHGLTQSLNREAKGISKFIYTGTLRVEIGYEPFGPPWCFVMTADRKRLLFEVKPELPKGFASRTIEEQIDPWLTQIAGELRTEIKKRIQQVHAP